MDGDTVPSFAHQLKTAEVIYILLVNDNWNYNQRNVCGQIQKCLILMKHMNISYNALSKRSKVKLPVTWWSHVEIGDTNLRRSPVNCADCINLV